MAYTTIDDPSAYFQTKIYTGTGSSQAYTFDGNSDMQPDWVWIKQRNGTGTHRITDSVRGVQDELIANATTAEDTNGGGLTAFGSDGFTLGDSAAYNGNNNTYVAWNWKAGTSFTNDASATGIGSIDSAGSASDASGFSICSYTGTGSAGTIKHGLSTTPSTIIYKRRNSTSAWPTWHTSLGTNIVELNSTGASQSGSSYTNSTVPTSSVFSIGTSGDINANGGTYIAYCFAEKKGYSKFGSYNGNGNVNGPFIFTGFKPAFCMVHRSSASGENWLILDNKRDTFNPQDSSIYPNLSNAEDADGADYFDFISNGMKVRTTNGGTNTSGATYIYMAFAENPFVTSTDNGSIPATAR